MTTLHARAIGLQRRLVCAFSAFTALALALADAGHGLAPRQFQSDRLGVTLESPEGWRLTMESSEGVLEGAIAVIEPAESDGNAEAVVAIYFVENAWPDAVGPLRYFGLDSSKVSESQIPASSEATDVPLVVWLPDKSSGAPSNGLTTVSALRIVRAGWLQIVYSKHRGDPVAMRSFLADLLTDYLTVNREKDIRYRVTPE
jgi:hypothetical protein